MEKKPSDVIVAYCGLVCSNCGAYLKEKCAGCHSDKPMYRNCKMKACAIEHGYITCADCSDFTDLKVCKKLNGVVSKLFGFVFRTDKMESLRRIREIGLEKFKEEKRKEGKI
ncbi:MAG: DUF3795 domain-containing protein [Candidatus Cloacimonetes bacterium]|nr:DUF3795 domain-containing protein [Candidatus Cloacimonadota bacterium]